MPVGGVSSQPPEFPRRGIEAPPETGSGWGLGRAVRFMLELLASALSFVARSLGLWSWTHREQPQTETEHKTDRVGSQVLNGEPEDQELAVAMALSLQEGKPMSKPVEQEDQELAEAMALSFDESDTVTQAVENENRYLDALFAQEGLVRQPVIGDGNCLFRSVAVALGDQEGRHADYRTNATEKMKQNPQEFTEDIQNQIIQLQEESPEEREHLEDSLKNALAEGEEVTPEMYIASMAKGGYGGELEIRALAEALGCPIYVYQQPNLEPIIYNEKAMEAYPLCLFRSQALRHYDALLPREQP